MHDRPYLTRRCDFVDLALEAQTLPTRPLATSRAQSLRVARVSLAASVVPYRAFGGFSRRPLRPLILPPARRCTSPRSVRRQGGGAHSSLLSTRATRGRRNDTYGSAVRDGERDDEGRGANGYVGVALKRLRDGGRETNFYLISRGFYERNGEKRWTRFVTVPANAEFAQWMGAAFADLTPSTS